MPIIYRALNKQQEEEAKLLRPITASAPGAKIRLEDHVERGIKLTPFISCTLSLDIAKYYALSRTDLRTSRPSTIIEINTDRISPHHKFDISNGKNPEERFRDFYHRSRSHCRRDKEYIIKDSIPNDAYKIIEISDHEWANYVPPREFTTERTKLSFNEVYGSPQASTSSGAHGGAHGGAGASGGASSSSFGLH